MTIIKKGPNEPPSKIGAAFSPYTEIKKEIKSDAMTGPAKEKFIRPPVKMSPPVQEFSNRRKKVVAVGWLVICIASIAGEYRRYDWGTPSLSWLVLLCATWALTVWLWPGQKVQIKRLFRLLSKQRLRKRRLNVAALLRENFIDEKVFENILNHGKNHPWVNLPKDCAAHGWRRMRSKELDGAKVFLEAWLEDRMSSIFKLEKLISKNKTTDGALLAIAQEKKPGIKDWRKMNWGELNMMISFVAGNVKK